MSTVQPPPSAGVPPLSATSSESLASPSPVEAAAAQGRGRGARTPSEIPLKGWWDIGKRVFVRTGEESFGVLAAGAAFYAMLAIFPALGAIVTSYALVSDPADIQAQFASVSGILPHDVATIINDQLVSLASREDQSLGFGLLFGILFAVFSARRGVDALVRATTVAYRERETRSFIHLNALTFALTLGAVLLLVTTIALLVVLPTAIAFLPDVSGLTAILTRAASWAIFIAIVTFSIGVLYRLGPPRAPARMRWLTPGSVVATLLWVAGSAGFSYYVSNFGNYNETYGTLGAIIVLLLWFFLTAYSIVLGALLNAEMEHQTARDTTVGGPKPLGERGAFVADTLGEIGGGS